MSQASERAHGPLDRREHRVAGGDVELQRVKPAGMGGGQVVERTRPADRADNAVAGRERRGGKARSSPLPRR